MPTTLSFSDFDDMLDFGNMITFSGGSLPDVDIDWDNFNPCSAVGIGSCGIQYPDGIDFDPGSLPTVTFNSPIDMSAADDLVDELQQIACFALDNGVESLITFDPFDQAMAAAIIAITQTCNDGGVIYASGGADYAEYILKEDPDAKFLPGEIVGVKNGKISSTTDGADQIFSISFQPIVVGNLPPTEEEEHLYAKVAMVGQNAMFVLGSTKSGDYIIPSGLNNGTALSISPEDLMIGNIPMIVGRAWEDSDTTKVDGINMHRINCSIGLGNGETAEILKQFDERMNQLETEVDELKVTKDQSAELEQLKYSAK